MAERLCLHCEISELLMRRQQAGEIVDAQTIGHLCEVVADIAVSLKALDGATDTFACAHDFLVRFEAQIEAGTYAVGKELVTAPARKTVN